VLRLPRLRKPPVVPHIVSLPELSEDLRAELGIPEDAVVFGRHGGVGTFSLDFVQASVRDASLPGKTSGSCSSTRSPSSTIRASSTCP
jgi:hypothetical protein